MTSMLQLHPPLRVLTPHGKGEAIIVIDYCINWNSVWVVVLDDSRIIQHYLSSDLKAMGNLMTGTKDPNEN